jgi:hypothetical protein
VHSHVLPHERKADAQSGFNGPAVRLCLLESFEYSLFFYVRDAASGISYPYDEALSNTIIVLNRQFDRNRTVAFDVFERIRDEIREHDMVFVFIDIHRQAVDFAYNR